MTSEPLTRLVTISAAYGAGGSVVAPALAQRLGVPFLQRATTTSGGIAGEPGSEPCFERVVREEADITPVHRLLAALTQAMPAGPTQSPPPSRQHDADLRRHCEQGIHDLADAGAGVILGRGAAVVLGKGQGFHVRLYGPAEARAVQGAAVEAVSLEEARGHLAAADRARDAYVRRLYRADPADPRHYHLMIDSTALPLDSVVEVIYQAVSALPAPVPAQASAPASARGAAASG